MEQLTKCNKECIKAKNAEPRPIGCFKDFFSRDLREFLGHDLTIEQCIQKGKDGQYRYVGL